MIETLSTEIATGIGFTAIRLISMQQPDRNEISQLQAHIVRKNHQEK